MPAAELPACVFCGEPIGPAQETAGRAPMAAHAACADAALADDTHWDAVDAASVGGGEPAEPEPAPSARRRGCLVVATVIPLAGLATTALAR